jgi:hypothetical protein
MTARTLLPLLALCFVMSSVQAVMLQLVAYSNVKAVVDEVTNDSLMVMSTFLQEESVQFEAVGPGQTPPDAYRNLRGAAEHGGRDLQFGTCPSRCTNSGSTYCRSIGCAFCGASCDRRLREALEAYGAAAVEADLNAEVSSYCGTRSNCNVYIKIFQVNDDGTTSELV